VSDLVSLGIGGATVEMGAHVCAFVHDRALRDEIVEDFAAEAGAAGHKCYCLLDGPPPAGARTGAAEVLTTAETYLAGGAFAAGPMLGRLEHLVERALDEGWPAVRAVGEMSWAATIPSAMEPVLRYESEVNRLAGRRQVLLCLYDLARFPAEALLGVLRTHPWMLVANVVLPSPYYQLS
jgi:hypothetical protein